MDGLRVLGKVVLQMTSAKAQVQEEQITNPEHVGILQVRLRVTLLRVDEVRELRRVADKEHGGVVEDPVEVALLSLDLDSEPYGTRLSNVFACNFACIDVPRGSRAVSAEPDSPPTVDHRMVKGAFVPTLLKSAAHDRSVMSWVVSKYP